MHACVQSAYTEMFGGIHVDQYSSRVEESFETPACRDMILELN
jgi:hypothetical protein